MLPQEELTRLANNYHQALAALADTLTWNREPGSAYQPFSGYPKGRCRNASEQFGLHLFDNYGVDTTIVWGFGERGTHAWLETDDGIIIDLTCGQFPSYEGLKPFVGVSSKWHQRWSGLSRKRLAPQADELRRQSEPAYSEVEAFLRRQPAV